MKNNKNILMWVLLLIAIVIVFLFPNIYNFISNHTVPKVGKSENVKKEEVKVVTDEVIADIHFPVMRNSKYNKDTYYSLDTFRSSDMKNEDKLLSGFLNLEKVNINNNTFKSTYMDLLIDNVLGKNVEYNLDRFYVPSDLAEYSGYWNYDINNNIFVYQGGSVPGNIEYYNLEQKIKAEYENRDIVIYYYVGFAKVENGNYIIYSDPMMTNVLKEGVLGEDNINNIFNKLDNKNKKIYKYVFKDTICSYSEYCLYEGKWVNEL